MEVALDMARVVANLQPLVVVACEHGGDAGDAGDAGEAGEAVVADAAIVQEPGSGRAMPRASRHTRQQQPSYTQVQAGLALQLALRLALRLAPKQTCTIITANRAQPLVPLLLLLLLPACFQPKAR
jgi:hypothetical protein